MLNEPEAQQKCPACGEANCFDHAIRTAKPQSQGGEPPEQIWMSFDPELDVWFQSSEPPGCFRDKGVTETPTLYVRADLPRATADDESLLTTLKAAANYICRAQSDHYDAEIRDMVIKALSYEINELERTSRATGETTVEAALAELRAMFPAKLRGNKNGRSIFVEYTEHGHGRRSGDSDICKKALIHVEYATGNYSAPLVIKGDSLADCMAQVRATRREGDMNDG